MKSIKSFGDFVRMNEAGWDSFDDLGSVLINGVEIATKYVCFYDTPNTITYNVYIEPTPQEMVKMRAWSENYSDLADGRIYLYDNSNDLTEEELSSMGAQTVRDIDDSDISGYFETDYLEKLHNEDMTTEQFIELVKSYDVNEDIFDIRKIEDGEEAKGFGLLGNFGVFDS
jgi:hypothetical protein